MVDRLLNRMWTRIGAILQDREPVNAPLDAWSAALVPPDAEQYQPDTVVEMYNDEQDLEDPVAKMNDVEFIKDYAAFLHAHYGRTPQYLTDLYCAMTPIMVEMTSNTTGLHTLHRYWWLPINHPLHIRMHAYREPNCGQVNAGFCGSCVIYADSVIVKWIGELWKLFYNELQQELQVPNRSFEQPSPASSPSEQNNAILVFEDAKHPDPMLPPPVVRMTPSVSNKKSD